MPLSTVATGQRITADHHNENYNLWHGVAGGEDQLRPGSSFSLDLSLANMSSGFKLPMVGTTTPGEGYLGYSTVAKAPVWGTSNSVLSPMSNPMSAAGDLIYGGVAGLPTRLGIGTSGQLLQTNSSADAPQWASLGPTTILDWACSSDVSTAAVTSGSWLDLTTALAFTVAEADSLVEIVTRGSMFVAVSTATYAYSRLFLDGVNAHKLGACWVTAGELDNPMVGSGPRFLSTLTSGAHTLKVQALAATEPSTMYLRALSLPLTEFLEIQVIEHKR